MERIHIATALLTIANNAEFNMEGTDANEFHFWEQVLVSAKFLAEILIREDKGEASMPEGYEAPTYVPQDIDL